MGLLVVYPTPRRQLTLCLYIIITRLRKREAQLKAKEELAEGLHLIDFEQLKIENQTYNEKIEERNEELLKLRKKITSTVQVSAFWVLSWGLVEGIAVSNHDHDEDFFWPN